MRTRKINSKGIALVTVVLFFLVLVILLGGVMFSSISNQGNAMLSKDHSSSYYIAESGLNVTIEKLKDFLVKNAYHKIPVGQYNKYMADLKTYIDDLNGSSTNLSLGTYTVNTDTSSSPYILRSTGNVGGTTRTVQTTIEITPILNDLMKAVYVKDGITVQANATIDGEIASLIGGNAIDISASKKPCQVEAIYVPEGETAGIKNCDPPAQIIEVPDTEDIEFDSIRIDDFYPGQPATIEEQKAIITPKPTSLQLLTKATSGTHVGEYVFPGLTGSNKAYYLSGFSNTGTMTFYLGENPDAEHKVFLTNATTALNSISNVNIHVKGKGKLQIFITFDTDDFSKNNKNVINNEVIDMNMGATVAPEADGTTDLAKFQLIVNTSGIGFIPTMSFNSSSPSYTGSIIADLINFEFKNLTFKGFIGTNGSSFTVGASGVMDGPMWVYAPDAKFEMQSSIVFNGAVISKSASFKGGTTVLNYKTYSGELPGDMQLPLFENGEPLPVGITVEFTNFKED